MSKTMDSGADRGRDAGAAAAEALASDRRIVDRRLRQIRRRLRSGRFLQVLFQDLLVAATAFALYLIAHRLVDTGLDPVRVFAAVCGASLVVSVSRGLLLSRRTLLDAAVAADDRLRLKDRVASAIYLRKAPAPSDSESLDGWRRLIEQDSARAIARADVARAFPVHLTRSAVWALGVFILTLVIPLVVPPMDLIGWRLSRQAEATMKDELAKKVEELSQSEEIEKLEKLAAEGEDPDLEEILAAIRELEDADKQPQTGAKPEPTASEEAKKQALVKMSQIEDLIEAHKARSDFEELRDLLDKMQSAALDPESLTAALEKALQEGDLEKAGEELGKLGEELGKLLDKQKQEGGLSAEDLARMQRMRDRLAALSRRSPALARLGKNLSGSGALSPRDLEQMMRNLEDMQLDMQSLEQLLQQLQALDQSLEALKMSKDELAKLHKCPNCGKPRQGPMQPGGT